LSFTKTLVCSSGDRAATNRSGAILAFLFSAPHRNNFRLGSRPVMPDDPKNALGEFVRFAQTLRGDEKSEAQSFLDHFFRALGHDGVQYPNSTIFRHTCRLCRRPPIRQRAPSNKANNNSAVSASPLSIFMKIQTTKPMR
jgi:hypothetical protein